MSVFKYVGDKVKPDGKVDIKVGRYSFVNITPDNFEIEVADGSAEEIYLDNAVDPFSDVYLYVKQ